ncbi:MAG: hypothetical protein MHM6MM_008601 [Cercozoa sp. M6MM]
MLFRRALARGLRAVGTMPAGVQMSADPLRVFSHELDKAITNEFGEDVSQTTRDSISLCAKRALKAIMPASNDSYVNARGEPLRACDAEGMRSVNFAILRRTAGEVQMLCHVSVKRSSQDGNPLLMLRAPVDRLVSDQNGSLRRAFAAANQGLDKIETLNLDPKNTCWGWAAAHRAAWNISFIGENEGNALPDLRALVTMSPDQLSEKLDTAGLYWVPYYAYSLRLHGSRDAFLNAFEMTKGPSVLVQKTSVFPASEAFETCVLDYFKQDLSPEVVDDAANAEAE